MIHRLGGVSTHQLKARVCFKKKFRVEGRCWKKLLTQSRHHERTKYHHCHQSKNRPKPETAEHQPSLAPQCLRGQISAPNPNTLQNQRLIILSSLSFCVLSPSHMSFLGTSQSGRSSHRSMELHDKLNRVILDILRSTVAVWAPRLGWNHRSSVEGCFWGRHFKAHLASEVSGWMS